MFTVYVFQYTHLYKVDTLELWSVVRGVYAKCMCS